jgi:hypothetical protein
MKQEFKIGDLVRATKPVWGFEFPYGKMRPPHTYAFEYIKVFKIVGKEPGEEDSEHGYRQIFNTWIIRSPELTTKGPTYSTEPPGAVDDCWAKSRNIRHLTLKEAKEISDNDHAWVEFNAKHGKEVEQRVHAMQMLDSARLSWNVPKSPKEVVSLRGEA